MVQSEGRGAYFTAVECKQAPVLRLLQCRQYPVQLQAGVVVKQAAVETVAQAQRVQHEFETEIVGGQFDLAGNALTTAFLQVGFRLA